MRKTEVHQYHDPVMLQECIEALNIKKNGHYVDVTYGGGGHSNAILEQLGPDGKLYAFDQDDDALLQAINDSRLTLIKSNFRYIKEYLTYFDAIPVDGVLADLGVSSHHLNEASRGFAFMHDGPLDMRMDQATQETAQKWINEADEKDLIHVFSAYGEIKNARSLAQKIIANRPFERTQEFAKVCKLLAPSKKENNYLARVFQAIRIYINDELGAIQDFLVGLESITQAGSRVAIMSYHSLEDKLIKKWMKTGNTKGELRKDLYGNPILLFKELTRKPIVAQEEELQKNVRSRSAKLRVAERNG